MSLFLIGGCTSSMSETPLYPWWYDDYFHINLPEQDTQCMYNVILRCVRVTIIAVEKQQVLQYYVCVSVFSPHIHGMQIASFLRCIILPSVVCVYLLYLPTLHHKRHGFRKTVIGNKMCALTFLVNFPWNAFHSTKNSARYNHKCR